MILFDIGANRGDVVQAALDMGYDKVVAMEPAPRMIAELSRRFYFDDRVIPLKVAMSKLDGLEVSFYDCIEDGLSTTNLAWINGAEAPYGDKAYTEIKAYTRTVDSIAKEYGTPDLVKIDVEGAELDVLLGMTITPKVTFEWQINWVDAVYDCLTYLQNLGYTEYALQYITHHLVEPTEYRPLITDFSAWRDETKDAWESGGWVEAGSLRPTADAGMIWVR